MSEAEKDNEVFLGNQFYMMPYHPLQMWVPMTFPLVNMTMTMIPQNMIFASDDRHYT